MAFLARTEVISDGVTANVPVSWPYLSADHIEVFVTAPDETVPEAYTGTAMLTSPTVMNLSPVPAINSLISVRRVTPYTQLLDTLTAPSVVNAAEQNLLFTQLLYILQERFDDGFALILTAPQYVAFAIEDLFAVGEVVGPFTFPFPQYLPAGLTGSVFASYNALTQDHIFSIRKNNSTEIGTLTFNESDNSVTVSFTSDVSFSIGDTLSLVTTQDGNLINAGITFKTLTP